MTTIVRIRQTFPHLESADALRPSLASRWERYLHALVEHEAGHAALGVDAAREVERQLLQMAHRYSCGRLEADGKALARDIIARYALRESQYDAASD